MKLHEIHKAQEEALRTPIAAHTALVFLFSGLMAIMIYFFVSLDVASSVNEYFSNSKAVRDSADSGSLVLRNLSSIASSGAWLEPLKILGISLLLFGIAISFAVSLLKTLKLRLQITNEFMMVFHHKK